MVRRISRLQDLFGFKDQRSLIFSLRLAVFGLFFLVFQAVILIQRPFLHVDFLYPFYLTMAAVFAFYGLHFLIKKLDSVVHYVVDVVCIYYLFNSAPHFASYYFIYVLLILFLAGLQLEARHAIGLGFLSSILLSAVNLSTTRWSGAQNVLTLSLFNFAYVMAVFISTQFKHEILALKDALDISNVRLRSKSDLSRLLIEQIPLGLLALNSKKEILFSNRALGDKLSLREDAAIDLVSTKDLTPQRTRFAYNSQLAEKRHYEIENADYFDHELNDTIQIHLIKDVSEMVVLQERVKQKEKLAAVGQLAAGIAHEIRNPLAGISGSIQLLSQDKNNSPDDQKLMRIIIKEIDRLDALITDFLDYSKPEKNPDQPVDLSFILDEVLQQIKLSPHCRAETQIKTQITKAVVYGYADKLKQGFINIIVNALQAMKDQSAPELHVATEVAVDKVTVRIRDNGSGMSAEVKNRIFEPFFTTKSKGTGLGMAITHKIFDSHQASVEIESQLNEGTEFKITFNRSNF